MADVRIDDHGTIVALTAVSAPAIAWLAANVADVPARDGFGQPSYACDHRSARDILEALVADGLALELGAGCAPVKENAAPG